MSYLLPSAIIRIVRRDGESRVTFTADAIRAAHLAHQLPLPSQPIINARIEATAYYTSDQEDALNTSLDMANSCMANPSNLVAERDLPSWTQVHGSDADQRKRFATLLTREESTA